MVEEGKIIPQFKVPSITTTSLREILNLFKMTEEPFKYCITKISAASSNMEKMEPAIENEKYGIKGYLNRRHDIFNINYEIEWDTKGKPKNPIDNKGIAVIEEAMRNLGIEDGAVDNLQVIIRDPEIGKLAGIDEELFHVTLTSDPVSGDLDREKVKEHPINEALIKQSGFKYRIMHTREVVDRRSELTMSKSQLVNQQKYIFYWAGSTVYSLRSPIKVAQRLREHYGPFRLLKTFGSGTSDTLVLLGVER
jgi:hypothetical protein